MSRVQRSELRLAANDRCIQHHRIEPHLNAPGTALHRQHRVRRQINQHLLDLRDIGQRRRHCVSTMHIQHHAGGNRGA